SIAHHLKPSGGSTDRWLDFTKPDVAKPLKQAVSRTIREEHTSERRRHSMTRYRHRLSAIALLAAISNFAYGQPPDGGQPAPTAPGGGDTATQPAQARRPEIGVWIGHAESSNLTRAPLPQRGSYDDAGLLLNGARDSEHFTGSINSSIELR